jgi:hypothetical protein
MIEDCKPKGLSKHREDYECWPLRRCIIYKHWVARRLLRGLHSEISSLDGVE